MTSSATASASCYDGWKANNSPSPFGRGAKDEVFVGNENFDGWAVSNGSDVIQMLYQRGNKIDQLLARIGSVDTNLRWPLFDLRECLIASA